MTNDMDEDDLTEIERLAELMNHYGLEEIDVSRVRGEFERSRIRLSRKARSSGARPDSGMSAPPTEAEAAVAGQESGTDHEAADFSTHPGVVVAPMIGTIFLQPEPGAPRFVEIGSPVTEGQTLLIIEAMKTMNQIQAPRGGTVRRIFVEDTSIVEFGTPLMIVE